MPRKKDAATAAQEALARTDRMAFLEPRHKEILRRRAAGDSFTSIAGDLDLSAADVKSLEAEALKIASKKS